MSQSTVQKIENIVPHPNADNLEIINLENLGWQVVAQKNIHKIGDKVVYIEIDSIVPERDVFEFLRNKHFRVRPIKLRGESSWGLILPIKEFGISEAEYDIDDDIDHITGVVKYVKELPVELTGQAKGNFPSFIIPKTDEINLLSSKSVYNEFNGLKCYVSLKADGSSLSFINKRGFDKMLCSRKLVIDTESASRDKRNAFIEASNKYSLFDIIPEGYAIQGEVVGPSVNGNKLQLKDFDLFVFNVFDISGQDYKLLGLNEMREFCQNYNLKMVEILEENFIVPENPKDLIDMAAKLKYGSGTKAEGMVIRPLRPTFSKRLGRPLSGKIINPNYKD